MVVTLMTYIPMSPIQGGNMMGLRDYKDYFLELSLNASTPHGPSKEPG